MHLYMCNDVCVYHMYVSLPVYMCVMYVCVFVCNMK